MSYNKYNWQTGEVITAEKLNHIEDGVEANSQKLVVNITMIDPSATVIQWIADKTYAEIKEAFVSNRVYAIMQNDSVGAEWCNNISIREYLDEYLEDDEKKYEICIESDRAITRGESLFLRCDSVDEYPQTDNIG